MIDKQIQAKKLAAIKALDDISSNMSIGIGSGSTVHFFIEVLGNVLHSGRLKNIMTVCSSFDSENICRSFHIPVQTLEDIEELQVYVDGADEVTSTGVSLKGLGGSLTREKHLRIASKHFVIIADETKYVITLGKKSPLCLEVIPFGYSKTLARIKQIKIDGLIIYHFSLRTGSGKMGPLVSDNNNFLADVYLKQPLPTDVQQLQYIEKELHTIAGVVESGLFADPANKIILGTESNTIKELIPNSK